MRKITRDAILYWPIHNDDGDSITGTLEERGEHVIPGEPKPVPHAMIRANQVDGQPVKNESYRVTIHTALNPLNELDFGTEVHIVYKGRKTSSNKREYHDFDIMADVSEARAEELKKI